MIILVGMTDETDPGLVNVNELMSFEFVPGEVPPRRPCHIGLAPTEESVEDALELLVNVPPRFPEYCHKVDAVPGGSVFAISRTILKRLVADPRLAIVNPLVTNDLAAEFETTSQPTIHEVTGKPSPTEPV